VTNSVAKTVVAHVLADVENIKIVPVSLRHWKGRGYGCNLRLNPFFDIGTENALLHTEDEASRLSQAIGSPT
jgi:hypothetical protein